MTNTGRIKDLGDVQELIKLLNLPRDFGQKLNEFVRQKYEELYSATRAPDRRFVMLWRNKFLTTEATSIDEMIATLRVAAERLAAMRADGVVLDPEGGTGDDYAHLVTTDPDVARKYGMEDESEYWGLDDEAEEDRPS